MSDTCGLQIYVASHLHENIIFFPLEHCLAVNRYLIYTCSYCTNILCPWNPHNIGFIVQKILSVLWTEQTSPVNSKELGGKRGENLQT